MHHFALSLLDILGVHEKYEFVKFIIASLWRLSAIESSDLSIFQQRGELSKYIWSRGIAKQGHLVEAVDSTIFTTLVKGT